MSKPWRMLLGGAFMPAWSSCDQKEKDEVFEEWGRLHEQWAAELGVKYLASLDDELALCGIPLGRRFNFYELYEVPTLDTVKKMLDTMRTEEPGKLRLDRYFRYEAVMGHPIGSLERRLAGK